MRRARFVALGVPVAIAGLLAVEVAVVVSRDYLPVPDYRVEAIVHPRGGPASGDVVAIAMLGDSTVAGIGSATLQEALPVLVAQRVADALDRSVSVVGHGVSGALTDDVRLRQVAQLEGSRLDAVVLVVGSNDATHVTPFWQMHERTEHMLITVRESTDAPVVLGGIPQFRTVPALPQPLRWVVGRYAAVLRERQRTAATDVEGAVFVDIARQASPRFLGRPESMSVDGFHPSAVGYGFWADALAPAVVQAVEDR